MSLRSMKFAFFVAITSARRVNEVRDMMADSSFTVFHMDKVSLHLYPKFTHKVVLEFHLNQTIHLPLLFPKSHVSAEECKLYSLNVQ